MNPLISYLDRLSLNTKLLLVIGVGFTMTLTLGLAGLGAIRTLSEASQQTYEQDLLGVAHILEAQADLTMMGRDLRWMAMSSSASDRAAARKSVVDAEASLRLHIDEGRKRIFRDEGQKALSVFDEIFPAYSMNVEFVIALLDKNDAFADGEATQFLGGAEYDKAILAADHALDAIAKSKMASAHLSAQQSAALAASAQQIGLILLLAGVAVSLGFGLLVGRSISRPLNDLRGSVEDLAAGRLDIAVPHTGLANEIGAMANALQVLQQGAQVTAVQLEAKSFLGDLAYRLQHVDSRDDFGQQVLSLLADRLGCRQGLLAAVASANDLDVVARYGAPAEAQRRDRYTFDDGLIGQCARERKPLLVSVPVDPDWRIRSGLGHAAPVEVRVLPLDYGGELVGVLELGFTEALDSGGEALLEQVLTIIALPLHGWRTGASKLRTNQRTHGSSS